MENKQEPIVIKKIHRLEPNKTTKTIILSVILILVLEVFCVGYSINKIKSIESSVEKSLTKPKTPADENEISYYRELSNKTDAAIERIIVTVGLFTALLSLVGLLLAFKVPHELKNKIDEIKANSEDFDDKVKKLKCQSETFTSFNRIFHNNTSLVSRNTTIIKHMTKIINKNLKDPSGYMSRAKVYMRLGKFYKKFKDYRSANYFRLALIDYSVAIELGEDAGECNNIIGMLYREIGDLKNALVYYNKAITVDSNNNMFFINRGDCYGELGKYQEALEDFGKAIALDAEEMSAYFGRSYIYRNMYNEGKDETKKKEYRALEVKDLEKVLEIDPGYSPAKERLNELKKGSAE